jgi:predicted DNA-binding transcriptional regulator AlpA
MPTPIDDSLRTLAEQIGEQIAAHLIERLRRGEQPVPTEYLTTFQVAQMAGFTPKALERLRAERKGPRFYKIGASVRYRVADVRAWIESGGPVE